MEALFKEGAPKLGFGLMRLTENFGKASECISCGKCEHVCPQHLPIRENLKLVAEQFENGN